MANFAADAATRTSADYGESTLVMRICLLLGKSHVCHVYACYARAELFTRSYGSAEGTCVQQLAQTASFGSSLLDLV
eukprot:4892298-Amphidinium_carterae.2